MVVVDTLCLQCNYYAQTYFSATIDKEYVNFLFVLLMPCRCTYGLLEIANFVMHPVLRLLCSHHVSQRD